VDLTWGILIHNSGFNALNDLSSKVRRNTIIDIKYGITALASNLTTQINCNTFTNPNIAITNKANNIRVASTLTGTTWNFGKLQTQGISCADITKPAGNKFSNCATSTYSLQRINVDFFSSSVGPIKYYHHPNSTYPPPPCYNDNVSVHALNCSGLDCDVFDQCCPPEATSITDCEQNPEQCEMSLSMLHLDRFDKEQLLSDGDAQALYEMIQNTSNSAAYVLNELLDVGNILSDSILIAAIARNVNALSDYQLKTLMIANSPLQPLVYEYLQQQPNLSERELLEMSINEIKRLEDDKIQALIYAYDITNKADSAASLLVSKGYIEQAIGYYMKAGNTNAVNYCIGQLRDSALRVLYTTVKNSVQNNGNLSNTSTADSIIYAAIATNSTKAGILASGLLHFTQQIPYSPLFPDEVEPTGNKQTSPHPLYYDDILPEKNYSIYPNPNNGQFFLISEGELFSSDMTVALYDMMGQLVYQCPLQAGKRKFEIQLQHYLNGNYLLKLYKNGLEVFKDKLTIIN
jgi:hypothetical protein